ncbi:hypothetical protein KQH60_04880 [Mycetohabitans sp. B8]|uniref:Uncharacterized protein n=1 Tax=Mycetohabitans sp. TaxID=2571162 RepID=A0A6B9HD47_9BURK|nr:hypothetical protein [Mycetohabitans sp. B8]MCG1041941.1 hypothetical protein [Mycetohabitans sp. B8]QGY72926.1 hypothetical protein [Mycetohabitans sp.]
MNERSKLIRNTAQEEAAIERGIAADTDTFVPTDEQFAQMKRRGGLSHTTLVRRYEANTEQPVPRRHSALDIVSAV